jgi:hypothetical protein
MTLRQNFPALINRITAGDHTANSDLYNPPAAKPFGTGPHILTAQAETVQKT